MKIVKNKAFLLLFLFVGAFFTVHPGSDTEPACWYSNITSGVVNFAHSAGDTICNAVHSTKRFFCDYSWLTRWSDNPIEDTLLCYLCDNQPTSNVHVLFSHGVGSSPAHGVVFKSGNFFPPNANVYGFAYDDQRPLYWSFPSPTKTSLAQDNDIESLESAYSDLYKKLFDGNERDAETKIIVYGVSRGATTPFTVLKNIQKNGTAKTFLKNVDAFVLEAPFASMDDFVRNTSKITEKICYPLSCITQGRVSGLSESSAHNLLSKFFQQYDPDGISAYKALDTMTKEVKNILCDIPILLVCTKKDLLVPINSTISLYKKLKEIGHKKVYIYIANNVLHGLISLSLERSNYQNVVQAFYKKNGVLYDQNFSIEEGNKILELSEQEANKY